MFDPFDPAQSRDAWPLLKELRDEGPVATVAGGLRYVTRHSEARGVLRDTATFSNIEMTGGTTVCERYTGNNTGAEPPETGSGPDGKVCIYQASDIHGI